MFFTAIQISGKDIRNVSTKWLHKHMALVGQEPILFAMSIKGNIKYGAVCTRIYCHSHKISSNNHGNNILHSFLCRCVLNRNPIFSNPQLINISNMLSVSGFSTPCNCSRISILNHTLFRLFARLKRKYAVFCRICSYNWIYLTFSQTLLMSKFSQLPNRYIYQKAQCYT